MALTDSIKERQPKPAPPRRTPVWLRRMQQGKLPAKDMTEAGR